jgi:hypothetical protein
MDVFRKIKTGLVGSPADIQSKAKVLLEKLNVVNSDIKKVRRELASSEKEFIDLKDEQDNTTMGEEEKFLTSLRLRDVSTSISDAKKKIGKLDKEKDNIKFKLDIIASSGQITGPVVPSGLKKDESKVSKIYYLSPMPSVSVREPPKRSLQSKVKSQIKKNPKTVKAVGAGLAVLGAYGLYKTVKRKSSKRSSKRKSKKSKK